MNIAPLTTRCHSSITGLSHTYRSLLDYISHHSLHPHSCPRSSRLHLFTIIQSHTHYINPGPSATLGRVLFSPSNFLFFVINNFYFLFFHTQHNRISKIKQNKTADTYSTSQGSIKREGEREGQQEHKVTPLNNYV